MMIFVTTTDALADEKLYEKAYSLIPEYRRVKADKMKMRENKLQTVTAVGRDAQRKTLVNVLSSPVVVFTTEI